MIGITAITAIASIVLGIIGIKQKSERKRMAIIGVILSSAMLTAFLGFYCVLMIDPIMVLNSVLFMR